MTSISNFPWTTLSSHELFHRSGFACAVHQDRYILMAGGFRRRTLRSAAKFDLHTQTHSYLPDFPYGNCRCKGDILGGYFYVVNNNEIYRMSLSTQSTWELVHSCDIKGYVVAVISDKNNLYIFNNYGMGLCYDPLKNESITMPRMATPRYGYASAIIGNEIYIIGGYGLASVEVYDISSQSWRMEPSLSRPLGGAAATVVGRWIVVTGGRHDKDNRSTKSFSFDTITHQWTQRDIALSPPRIYHSCVSIGSQVVSVGGAEDYGYTYLSIETIAGKYLIPKWDIIKHFILLRQLIDDGRAVLVPDGDKTNNIVEKKLQIMFFELDIDMFREVLSFLI